MGIRHEEVPGTRRRMIAVGLRILKVALLAPLALVGLCVCINRVHLCFSRCQIARRQTRREVGREKQWLTEK